MLEVKKEWRSKWKDMHLCDGKCRKFRGKTAKLETIKLVSTQVNLAESKKSSFFVAI